MSCRQAIDCGPRHSRRNCNNHLVRDITALARRWRTAAGWARGAGTSRSAPPVANATMVRRRLMHTMWPVWIRFMRARATDGTNDPGNDATRHAPSAAMKGRMSLGSRMPVGLSVASRPPLRLRLSSGRDGAHRHHDRNGDAHERSCQAATLKLCSVMRDVRTHCGTCFRSILHQWASTTN